MICSVRLASLLGSNSAGIVTPAVLGSSRATRVSQAREPARRQRYRVRTRGVTIGRGRSLSPPASGRRTRRVPWSK
jgi:hypothetical protein